MHCPKCLKYVPYGAKYCQSCGEAIPTDERSNAYKKTIWGKLQRIEDWYKTLALKKITDSVIFKVLILLIILGIGLFNVYRNGTQLKIMDSDMYNVQYNTALEEYYILTDADEVVLNLYIPKKTEGLLLTGYDESGNVLEKRTLTASDYEKTDVLRVRKDEYAYLTLDAAKENTGIAQLKFLVLSEPQHSF